MLENEDTKDLYKLISSILSQLSYRILIKFKNYLHPDFERTWGIHARVELRVKRLAPDIFLKVLDGRKESQRRHYGHLSKIEPCFGLIFSKYLKKTADCYCEGFMPNHKCKVLSLRAEKLIFNDMVDQRYVALPMDASFFLPDLPNLECKLMHINDPRVADFDNLQDADKYVRDLNTFMDPHRLKNPLQPICLIVMSYKVITPVYDVIKKYIMENSHRNVAVWGGLEGSRTCKRSATKYFRNTTFCSGTFDCTIFGLTAPNLNCYSLVVNLLDLREEDYEEYFNERLRVEFRAKIVFKKHNVGFVFGGGCSEGFMSYCILKFKEFFVDPLVPLIGCLNRKGAVGINTFGHMGKSTKLSYTNAVTLLVLTYNV